MKIQEKIVQVPQVIEKIVQVAIEKTQVRTVEQIVEKVVEVAKSQVYSQDKIIVQDRIK